jgi:anti-anti-sigma factor
VTLVVSVIARISLPRWAAPMPRWCMRPARRMLTLPPTSMWSQRGHRHVGRRARWRVGDQAYGYVRDVIDAYGGPVLLDVVGLSFCDAGGLGAFARMSRHAAQAGSSVHLVAPPPLLRKIIRITGLAGQLPVHRADQAGHMQVA